MKLSNRIVSILVAVFVVVINLSDAHVEKDGIEQATRVLFDEKLMKVNSGDMGDVGGRKTRRKLDPVDVDGEWVRFSFRGPGSEITVPGVTPPYTFTGPALLDVTDAFCKGDQFEVFDNGVSIGKTPFVPEDGCADTVDTVEEAFADPTFSSGSFLLGTGSHSIQIFASESPYGAGGAFFRLSSCDMYAQFLDVNNPDFPLELMGDKLDLCKYKDTGLTIEAVVPCSDKAKLKLFDAKTDKRLVANTETVRPYTLGKDIDATGELLPVDELKVPGEYRLEISSPGKKDTFKKTFQVGYYC